MACCVLITYVIAVVRRWRTADQRTAAAGFAPPARRTLTDTIANAGFEAAA